MAKTVISEELRTQLLEFLTENPRAELVNAYLFFIERKFDISAVAFPRGKKIYQSVESAVKILENKEELWRETQIKISVGTQAVNESTSKIYICPFTGKVFGDNTHPNPQDAIYDWVSRCPENNERSGGLRVKRFFVSEDPDVIKSYIKPKKTVTKVVYSSVITGKLFHSKSAIIKDFKNNYVKKISLLEVQSQNRYEIEDEFLAFLHKQLDESKITSFVESIADYEEFHSFVGFWVEDDSEDAEDAEDELEHVSTEDEG